MSATQTTTTTTTTREWKSNKKKKSANIAKAYSAHLKSIRSGKNKKRTRRK